MYCSEDFEPGGENPEIGRILEFNDEEGTFIFAFRKYQTINHIFYIDSQFARGGKELIMITYMMRAAYFKNEITDVFKYLQSKTPLLEDFAQEIAKLNELPAVLQTHQKPESQLNGKASEHIEVAEKY